MRPFRILLSLLLALFTYACKDLHELDCFFWSNLGECEANPFVALRCQASCGSCTADGNATRGPDVVVIDASGAEQLLPFPDAFDDPIVSIESGELHLVMLLASGTVVTFGDDSSGQLGQPKVARRVPITQRSPGVVSWPDPHTSKSAVAIRAGRLYSGALLDDGTLVLWGQNTNGQCGIAPEETPMDAAPLELSALQVLHAAARTLHLHP